MSYKYLFMFIIIVVMFLNGCTKAPIIKESITLKVMDFDEYSFNQRYGRFFAEKFPNIKIKVIPFVQALNGNHNTMKQLITNEQPDVIMLSSLEMYKELAEEGYLLGLDPLIRKGKFDLDSIYPPLIEFLRTNGNGTLYGLTPTISSQAVFYNIDLFDQYGITHPTDGMSWKELLQLAQRFPVEKGGGSPRVYGFFSSGFEEEKLYFKGLIEPMGKARDLAYIDDEQWKVIINNKEWKQVFQLALDSIQSGAVSINHDLQPELFVTGDAAMTINQVYLVSHLSEIQNEAGSKPFSWGLVTLPVEPEYPNNASWLPGFIYAVNSKSAYQQQAWDAVKLINSDEVAKYYSDPGGVELYSRTNYMKERNGHDLSAFVKVRPNFNATEYRNVPKEFYDTFREIANQHFKDILDGKTSLDQALQDIQDKGQMELEKVKVEVEKSE